MKRLILTLAAFAMLAVTAIAQNFEWAKQIGGPGNDAGRSITVDAFGNVYTTGSFNGIVDFDPGPGVHNLTSAGSFEIFISKLDANGNFLWAKSMGGTLQDYGNSITTDPTGNVYTTGTFQGTADFDPGVGTFNLTSAGSDDIFICKLDAHGNFVWAKSMGGTGNDGASSIALDASGNVYTTGSFNGTADFDPGTGVYNLTGPSGSNIFISKLDGNGEFIWAKAMGSLGANLGRSITIDSAGNVYTTGSFRATVDFDPGSGVYNLTALSSIVSHDDAFISKLDSNGNFIWAKALGGTGDNKGYSITTDSVGNVYTTGPFSGTVDFDPGPGVYNLTSAGGDDIFISKLDANGNFIWAKSMGGTGHVRGGSIVDAAGNVYTTGGFQGTADFDPGLGTFNLTSAGGFDIFISKLDANGNFVWAKSIGGTGDNSGGSTLDPVGNIYTTGSFRETVDFDPGPGVYNLTSAGGSDIFIHKISQCTPPALSTSTTSPLCPGGIGTAAVSATGGTGPYTYTWSNSHTGPGISGVPAGTYTVTVTDSISCAAIAAVTITEPPAILAGASVAHPPCFGSTGAISLSPVNGTSPYAYLWSTAATTASVSGLAPGMYTVTITDSAGCTAIDSFDIHTAPPVLDVSTSVSMPQCYGGDGAVVASVSGGVAPYAYLWSTGATTSILGGIPAGAYSLTVTDKNSCSDTTAVSIPQPPVLAAVLAATESQPAPNCDGTAKATASGGASPFTYFWSHGATGESISGLCAGMYEVTITDSRGCTRVDSVSVPLNTGISSLGNGSIKVYPNPSDGHFVLETGGMYIRVLRVYNALGERVLTLTSGTSQTFAHVMHIDLSSHQAGIYLLVVELEGHTWYTKRLVLGQ